MASQELIQERFISGKGILKVPSDTKKNRYTILYLDVIRRPTNRYANLNWNPPRGKYAFLTFLRNGYVIDTRSMEFDRESYDGIADISGQTLIAVKCAYDGILDTFVNLSVALGATPGGVGLVPISKNNNIKDYENLLLGWDEVRVVCYADTALQARLYRTAYDVCNPDFDNQQPPPPPPPPLPPVPPGTPLANLSPPYEGADDGGNTVPYPSDSVPPPFVPLPDNTKLKWNVSTSLNPRTTYVDAVFDTFTPVSNYSVRKGNTDASLNAQEWLTQFTSGTSIIPGSAVGSLNPEDKPILYLWQEGVTDAPYQTFAP